MSGGEAAVVATRPRQEPAKEAYSLDDAERNIFTRGSTSKDVFNALDFLVKQDSPQAAELLKKAADPTTQMLMPDGRPCRKLTHEERTYAIDALKEMSVQEAHGALVSLGKVYKNQIDARPTDKHDETVECIAKLGTKQSVDILIDLVSRAFSQHTNVFGAAADRLAELGSEYADSRIKTALQKGDIKWETAIGLMCHALVTRMTLDEKKGPSAAQLMTDLLSDPFADSHSLRILLVQIACQTSAAPLLGGKQRARYATPEALQLLELGKGHAKTEVRSTAVEAWNHIYKLDRVRAR